LGIKGRAKGLLFPIPVDTQDEVHPVFSICLLSSCSPSGYACLGPGWYVLAGAITQECAFADQTGYPTGHGIVATIAELHLDPTVLPTLCSILGPSVPGEPCSLASVATWADEVRKNKTWSAPMHYINAIADHPPKPCLFPGAQGWDGDEDVNVLGAIRNTTNLLGRWVKQGSDLSDSVASEALKFLIHFVGDMHMPFHLVARGEGATTVFVKWSGERVSKCFFFFRHGLFVGGTRPRLKTFGTELHSMWDGDVVERAMETTPAKWKKPLTPEIEQHLSGKRYDPLIRKVLVEGVNKVWPDEVESWVQCPAVERSPLLGDDSDDQTVLRSQRRPSDWDDDSVCPLHWATPIHQLACDWVWPKKLDQPPYNKPRGPLLELDTEDYAGRITKEWLVEKLLTMGGLRLASILNVVFAEPRDH